MMISRRYLMTAQAILGVLVLTFGLLLVQGCSKAEHADDDHADNGEVSYDDDANHDDAGEADDYDDDAHDDDDDDDANGDAHHDDDDDDDDANGDAHHDDDDDHAEGGHGEPVDFSAPQTYAHAVEAIHAQLEKIESLMATGGLDRVHAEAAVIRDIANGIGQLALKDGSGVPREAVREINLTAKDLAATFGPIDQAGDSGNLAGTRIVYDQMVALFETLEKHAPDHDDDDH
ncbi:MAG: hypothetical protein IIA64_01155 [Planctomycetes bacterium]|nr:hypothetical protein [Planctomycetota bacterium]